MKEKKKQTKEAKRFLSKWRYRTKSMMTMIERLRIIHIQNGHIHKEALLCCKEKKLMKLVSKHIIDYLLP